MSLVEPGLGLIFWTTIVFLLLLFVLGKYAWTPILTAVKAREKSIEDSLFAAEQAKEEIKKLTSQNEELLHLARLERDAILKEALDAANKLKNDAAERAHVEANKIVDNAKLVINAERKKALSEINELVANLSVEIAEKIVRKELSKDKAQQELIDDSLKRISSN